MPGVLAIRPAVPRFGEMALTATLLSIYVGCRGAAYGLGAAQAVVALPLRTG